MKKKFYYMQFKTKKIPSPQDKRKNKNKNTNQIIAFNESFATVSLITDISVHNAL